MIIEEPERQIVVGALDTLASLLADHGHAWTEGERTIYEQALAALGAQQMAPDWEPADDEDADEDDEDDGEAWKETI